MIDLHLSAFAPRWRFLYAVRFDAYDLMDETLYPTDYDLGDGNSHARPIDGRA